MVKFKKLITALILFITLCFSTSCITLVENEEKDIINDLASNKVISATFSVDVYRVVDLDKQRIAQGSGVVFSRKENFNGSFTYYLLTNNHVVASGPIYAVKDCYGEELNATLVKSDANYDLAVLKFTSSENYRILNFVKNDVKINDKVISIGTPNGQVNAITFGKVEAYTKVTVDGESSESNVKFHVIEHSAPIYSGSSGGVLLTYSYEICGINYACSLSDDVFVASYAVSASKVLEFING